MRQERRFAVVIMVGALVLLGWFLAKWLMSKGSSQSDDGQDGSGSGGSWGGGSSGSGGGGGSFTLDSAFPLKRGSRGAEVLHLQKWLNATTGGKYRGVTAGWTKPTVNAHQAIDEDSIFGANTEAALYGASGYKTCSKSYYDTMDMANY